MTCAHCQVPTAEGVWLCIECVLRLEAILDDAPDLLAEADVTIARMDRVGRSPGGGGASREGVDIDALEKTLTFRELLTSWARLTLEECDERGVEVGDGLAPAQLLRENTGVVRLCDWAGDCLEELHEANRRLAARLDVPRERRIVGTCSTLLEDGTHCPAKLTVSDPDQQWVKCRNCGSWFSLAALEAQARHRARGVPMRRTEVCRFLSQTARVRVSGKDIDNWVALGRLAYVLEHVPSQGKPIRAYFPGDVLAVKNRMNERRRAA